MQPMAKVLGQSRTPRREAGLSATSRRLGYRLGPAIWPLAVLALVLIGWSLYARSAQGHVFPTPRATVTGFWHSLLSPANWRATALSWRSLAIGYGVAGALGLPLGLVMGVSRRVDRVLGIYLDIALVTPMIVLMPVVLMAIGVTATAEVVVVIFFALPYVTLPVRNGVRALPQLWFDLARSLCATRSQVWRFILLPGARAGTVHGLRLGLAHALSGLFIVELTLVSIGTGKVIMTDEANFDFGAMIGYIVLVMLQALIVMTGLRYLDRNRRDVAL
jgi:ABC-type nitrate/sulfonate/bicarbonate transport system permease component